MSISRAFLLELSNSLGEKDLKQLKFLCKGKIGERQLEGIDEGYQLFEALEKRNLLSKNNKKFLASILATAERDDLSIKLNNYGNEHVGLQKGANFTIVYTSLGLQPRDKAAMLGVKTKEFFLKEFT